MFKIFVNFLKLKTEIEDNIEKLLSFAEKKICYKGVKRNQKLIK